MNWSTYNTAPTIVDNRIYMLDESASFVAFSTDGERLIETPVFPGKPLGWMNASADGRLFAAIYPTEFVLLSSDGEVLGLWEDTPMPDRMGFQPMLDGSLIVQAGNSFTISALTPDLETIWRTPHRQSVITQGAIIDTQGRVGFQDQNYDQNFIVLDGASGALLFEKHPHINPRGSYPVMIRPGQVILTGHDPLEDYGHIQCIEVPELGLPARDGWSTPLANFKNQRRIRTLGRAPE
ncbi:MAG: hypothetical protein IT385_05230 [Deltaproteobacteria bacterium]|nr:hypothetical protein [Deltaproteobacteria bacterium]